MYALRTPQMPLMSGNISSFDRSAAAGLVLSADLIFATIEPDAAILCVMER